LEPQNREFKNWLITGGCGFIGTALISKILEEYPDDKVRVLDNLSVGTRQDLEAVVRGRNTEDRGPKAEDGGRWPEDWRVDGLSSVVCHPSSGVRLIVGDIRDGEVAKEVCRGADVIVHLAANTGVIPSIEDPMADCMANVIGTVNFLEAARKNGVKRFVFASSGAPLGEQEPPIHEEMVARPVSPYGASKLCGEAYCSAYYHSFGLETVALRFGNVYGPRSTHKGSVVAKFIKNILAGKPLTIYGDGQQTRDFIYIEDLVNAILLALERPNVGGEVFQIATHREHTVGEVAEVLNRLAQKHLGRKSKIVYEKERKGEVRRNYSDISKARRMLGFEPKWELEAGLEATFNWFLKNR
jgi:UDP-glucose 4-epimerase